MAVKRYGRNKMPCCVLLNLLLMLVFMVFGQKASAQVLSATAPEDALHLPVTITCGVEPWPQIVWFHPHANETTSARLAVQFLRKHQQGCLYQLQQSNSRYLFMQIAARKYRFDPNRIFTPLGRQRTLGCQHTACTAAQQQLGEATDEFIRQYLSKAQLIVALHNNRTDGLSVNNYVRGGLLARNVVQVFISPQAERDDFFYVTSARAFDFFAQRHFNVVLQDNQRVDDDGSLSVWAADHQVDYINIEAGMNHETAQQSMLVAVWQYMHQYYSSSLLT